MKYEKSFEFLSLVIVQQFSKYEMNDKEKGYLQNNKPLAELKKRMKDFYLKKTEKESLKWDKAPQRKILEEKSDAELDAPVPSPLSLGRAFLETLCSSFDQILRNRQLDQNTNYVLFSDALNFCSFQVNLIAGSVRRQKTPCGQCKRLESVFGVFQVLLFDGSRRRRRAGQERRVCGGTVGLGQDDALQEDPVRPPPGFSF